MFSKRKKWESSPHHSFIEPSEATKRSLRLKKKVTSNKKVTKSRVRDDNVIGAISLDDQLCMIHCVRAGSVCHRSAPKYYDFKILSMFPINKSVATLATLFLRCGYLKKKKY